MWNHSKIKKYRSEITSDTQSPFYRKQKYWNKLRTSVSGERLSLSSTLILASSIKSRSTILKWLADTARCSGVRPSLSNILILSGRHISVTLSSLPSQAAKCSFGKSFFFTTYPWVEVKLKSPVLFDFFEGAGDEKRVFILAKKFGIWRTRQWHQVLSLHQLNQSWFKAAVIM